MADADQKPSCPVCGSYSVTMTTEPDEDGFAEFHCDDCGEYFTDLKEGLTYDDIPD